MKKAFGVGAVGALFASSALAATVDTRIVKVSGDAGGIVTIAVQAQLSGGTAGLALIGANVTLEESGGAAALDLCDIGNTFELLAPAGMATFDRLAGPGPGSGFSNWGLTNPGDNAPTYSGYSGTCDGNGGLLQIGGGQNTIGNTPGGAPYPIGAVVQNIGNTGYVNVAVGFVDATTLTTGQWEICLDTVFANTINSGQVSAPFAVTEATAGTNACLTITAGILCPAADVNCDGNVTGLDLAVVTATANWLKPAWPAGGGALCDRADVNNDGNVTGLDLAAITAGGTWLTSHGACSCETDTPGAGGCPNP